MPLLRFLQLKYFACMVAVVTFVWACTNLDLPSIPATKINTVIGQPDAISDTANNGGVSASSIDFASGVWSDGTRLYVSDKNNHRVLIWNSIPSSFSEAASLVLGQNDFSSSASTSLNDPRGIFSDGTKLYVADSQNNRVLVWNTIPTTNNQSFDFAISAAGPSGSNLFGPEGVYSDGTYLFVTDTNRNRVIIWTLPVTASSSPTWVLGQTNFTNGGSATSQSGLSNPVSIFVSGGDLFLTDMANNRVMGWGANSWQAIGSAATLVVGQNNFVTGTSNTTQASMSGPRGVYFDGEYLYVADMANHRILVWDGKPTTNAQPADYVLGQSDFTSSTANSGGISLSSLKSPAFITGDGTNVYIADRGNHRIIIRNLEDLRAEFLNF